MPDPHIEQSIHIGDTTCLLCRQRSETGDSILDISFNKLTVPTRGLSCSVCSKSPNPEIWLHSDCYCILRSRYEDDEKPKAEELKSLAEAIKSRYPRDTRNGDMPAVREGLHSIYARPILHDTFKQDLLMRFPMEITSMITEFIGPLWYLIVLGETRRLLQTLRRNINLPQSNRISLTEPLHCLYVNYQGQAYVSRICKTAVKDSHPLLQEGFKAAPATRKIVLSVDDIGVRRMQFLDQTTKATTDGSPWYQTIDVPESVSDIDVGYNSLFVCDLSVPRDRALTRDMIWSSPNPPQVQPWNIYSVQKNYRLTYLETGDEVQGLFVCCTNSGIKEIYAAPRAVGDLQSFIKPIIHHTSNSDAHWVYFPINVGETIDNAWVRKTRGMTGAAAQPFLTIRTSFGRLVTFGPQPPANMRILYECRSLRRAGDGAILGFIHDGLDYGNPSILTFGVTCDPAVPVKDPQPEPPFPLYKPPPIPYRRGSPANTWFFSKARLESLHSVQACHDRQKAHRPLIGLLLHYDDGHVESVGQFRWDQEITPDILAPVHIQYGFTKEGRYLKTIETREQEKSDWYKVPLSGTLVWWFGHLGEEIATYAD
ncbi:hypothetical protein BDV18DRAFT_158168 [Aspergillus unguis]